MLLKLFSCVWMHLLVQPYVQWTISNSLVSHVSTKMCRFPFIQLIVTQGLVIGRVISSIIHLVSVWLLPRCVMGHRVMSHQVLSKGLNIWIVEENSGRLGDRKCSTSVYRCFSMNGFHEPFSNQRSPPWPVLLPLFDVGVGLSPVLKRWNVCVGPFVYEGAV